MPGRRPSFLPRYEVCARAHFAHNTIQKSISYNFVAVFAEIEFWQWSNRADHFFPSLAAIRFVFSFNVSRRAVLLLQHCQLSHCWCLFIDFGRMCVFVSSFARTSQHHIQFVSIVDYLLVVTKHRKCVNEA